MPELDDLEELFPKQDTSSDKMDALFKSCEKLQIAMEYIEKLEEKLKQAKEKLVLIEEIEIPELMDAMNIDKFTLKNGRTVSVKPVVRAHINEDNKDAAFAWLDEHGHSDIIKTDVGIKFNREEFEAANKLAVELMERGLSVTAKNNVHYQTLCSFVREQLENGENLPTELFGIVLSRKATLK